MQLKLKNAFILLFFSLFLIAFVAIGVYRFNIGQVFYYDFGIFAHTIWQLSRFQVPVIDHLVLGKIIFLGDHFNPGLAILAPLFWITSDLRILLIEQAFALVAAGFVIYKIAEKFGLRTVTSLCVAASYLLFAGTENPLVTDWHPEPTAAFLILLFYYLYVFTKKRITYLVVFIAFLSLKESNAISIAALLIPIFFLNREKRKETAILFVSCVLYFFFCIRVAIPYFSHQGYIYSPNMPYSPTKIVQNFGNSPQKVNLMHNSFLSFGYLPIISGAIVLPVITEFAFRLAPNTTIFNNLTLGQHYNVLLGAFLALSTAYTLKNIKHWTKNNSFPERAFSIYLLLIALYVARKITGSPINLAVNKIFWQELQPRPSLFSVINKVPHSGSVMAQNSLLPYLVNRTDSVSLTTVNYELNNPKIILLDLSESQNVNNFYGSDKQVILDVNEKLKKDSKYKVITTDSKDMYLYVKR